MTDASSSGTSASDVSPSEWLQTPSQTIGPFFDFALPYEGGPELVPGHHPLAIRVHGTVFDGSGEPIPDAVIEIWQADERGILPTAQGSLQRDRYTFTGFGRDATTLAGAFNFTTIKPGPVEGKAPYVLVTIFARGLTHHLFSRAYFDDEPDLNGADPLLLGLPDDRRSTLIAVSDAEGSYRFDIRLQGENETVFLEFG
jgi:protocatechuate 3,4-dioxygenase, alpha subunit